MSLSSYVAAFCLLFVLYLHTAASITRNKPFHVQDGVTERSVLPLPLLSSISFHGEGLSGEITLRSITSGNTGRVFGLITHKPRQTNHHQLLRNFKESPSSLTELAARATEILDRISLNWALEGAKTIQNGEIQLRKLNKDLTERVDELLSRGLTIPQHVRQCMNRTVFETGLDKILDDANECYSESLRSLQIKLKETENEGQGVLERMNTFGKKIFEMLLGCFSKEDTSNVIECLQKVDSVHVGSQIREVEGTNLLLEMTGVVNDIPRAIAGCTSKALAEVEAHVRRSYAQSLTCLKGTVT